ncbi:MBL fold metallo-hydrolase [Gulosibacter molinativorax]|uniref:Metallo-beta-lactamase domain-containing protein n=1 Tax=Gulosibacter molinativorax TaxID=256821 RepID=A0ABT7C4A7_9MICO|nr:MBL fold metallo-hydrolase [Gulosibacter molinativorax]MDJ1370053.1 hypothetical protein [Gulosibacter molinativorax]QUY63756.1 Zn-dependent hydrolase of the beta-lactamase fold-like protein [Gulosibacter molinativorax]
MDEINVTLIGGPTLLIEYAGVRILTDPTFDPPQTYHHPIAGPVIKKNGPAMTPEELGAIDLILASHEHIDNLDVAGRGFLTMMPLTLTTVETASNFGANVLGLEDGQTYDLALPDGRSMKITAVPAHHGPEGVWEALGPVIGFVLEVEGAPTIYFSGDNSELDIIEGIAANHPNIDVAVLNVGGAKFDVIADGAYITFSNERALEATRILGAKKMIAVHEDSWAHFSQDAASISELFATSGSPDTVIALGIGESERISL